MKNLSLLFLFLSLFVFSCDEIDEDVLPMIGVYEANVIGLNGPFSLSIIADHDDNIKIEAPFDGEHWEVISADVDDEEEDVKDIEFFDTEVANGVIIRGEGFFVGNSIQLDYEIIIDGESTGYTIVGSKI